MCAEAASATAATPARPGVTLPARNFWVYFGGNVVSSCGTWFANIAQTLVVYRLTGSVFLVGVLNLLSFAGVFLLGPSAGVAADRYDRRRILLVTQTASSCIAATLAILAASGSISVPAIMVCALLLGLSQTFTVPSLLALVPQLVEPEQLDRAVALNMVTFNVARAVGPLLGAIVVERFGVAAAFSVNAVSFAALIAVLLAVEVRPAPRPPRSEPRPRLLDTVASVRRRPEVAVLFVAGTFASMTVDPVTTLGPEVATKLFHQADTLTGWLIGAFGLGAVLAGVRVSRQPPAPNRQLARRMMGLGAAMVAFVSTPWLGVGLLALVAAGYSFIAASAAALARVQRSSSLGEQGRLMALWSIAFMGSRPIASVIDGAVASWTNARLATYLMALPAFAAAAVLGLGRRTAAN